MKMRYLVVLTVLVGLALAVGAVPAAEKAAPNRCHNPESWPEWRALIAKYPTDRGLHTLHALRIGICIKVERGDLPLAEGTAIFEQARQSLLAQWQAALQKQPPRL